MPAVKTSRGEIWVADHRRDKDAPIAMLIHGAGGSHLSFPAELRRQSAWNAILPDLPGHGKSAGNERADVAEYALDALAVMDALDIESAFIGGHSMGGAVAQCLALEHPRRVNGLALICTGARLPVNPALIDAIVEQPFATINSLLRWMWSRDAPAELVEVSAAILRSTAPEVIQRDFMACAAFDVRARLGEITAPTLVVAGAMDRMTPLALSEELANGVPRAKLATVEGAGHMAHLEQADKVAAELAGFICKRVSS